MGLGNAQPNQPDEKPVAPASTITFRGKGRPNNRLVRPASCRLLVGESPTVATANLPSPPLNATN